MHNTLCSPRVHTNLPHGHTARYSTHCKHAALSVPGGHCHTHTQSLNNSYILTLILTDRKHGENSNPTIRTDLKTTSSIKSRETCHLKSNVLNKFHSRQKSLKILPPLLRPYNRLSFLYAHRRDIHHIYSRTLIKVLTFIINLGRLLMSPTLFTAVCVAERVSATKNDHHSKNAANISTGTLRKHNSDAAHQFRL